ncbi:MAG: hypothetical protein WD872_17495 [Pirellulaceae bacterium]
MIPRFSLRTFLATCIAVSFALALGLQWLWKPVIGGPTVRGITPSGTRYKVHLMTENDPFKGIRLLNAIVIPEWTEFRLGISTRRGDPSGTGLVANPDGVFFAGKRIAGSETNNVVVVQSENDVRVLSLSAGESRSLDEAAAGKILETTVWRTKVEPEIERLVASRPKEPGQIQPQLQLPTGVSSGVE